MYSSNVNNDRYMTSSEDDDDDDDGKRRERLVPNRDTKLWDSFQDPPTKSQAGSSAENTARFEAMVKVFKIVVSIFVFLVILISAILSKMSLLFMTSHLKENNQVPFCNINQPEKEFLAVIPTEQRIGWLWAIFFTFAIPEAGTLFRSCRICYFKNIPKPHWFEMLIILVLELFHVMGLLLLVTKVLPNLDVIQGVMLMNCVCFVPSILSLFSRSREELQNWPKTALDVIAIMVQITGMFAWPILNEGPEDDEVDNRLEIWMTPLALFLISFHWWENYVSNLSCFGFMTKLSDWKDRLADSRYHICMFSSTMKIAVFLIVGIFFSNIDFATFFTSFKEGWGNHTILVIESEPILSDIQQFPSLSAVVTGTDVTQTFPNHNAILWIMVVHIISTYICFVFSKFACKIQVQTFSFAFPLNLTVPITISILLILCGLRATDTCIFYGFLPDYLFFTPPPVYALGVYLRDHFAWFTVLWILSQTWITKHIWFPKADKNAFTDKLFVTPLYNSLMIDQSITLNRRRADQDGIVKKKDMMKSTDLEHENEIEKKAKEIDEDEIQPQDRIPQIFICATMWHENKEEMMEFLKSILRLDEDQCARRMAMKFIQAPTDDVDPEYYDLETHIFFDDAFIRDKTMCDEDASPLNEYVKLLVNNLEEAAREVYKTNMKIFAPTKTVTPYGGRLEWTLPGRTKMIAHLKHADKIRKKKRWSQVMYMYYLLGYKIMQLDASDKRKLVIAHNTFLLALDGDIDFQPNAVSLLIGRMRVDENLGAACGRIHPVGGGPMVWYQKFEYAIGHWLQKATEHVIGCVLCSPGCFSLFRGRALMENSVMKKYTTNSEQARHHVQYDQGEDRWLCTLLLKQRFRVEYSAASDAYTHSPEGFNEFYNQRRRWVPSTMANIFDLLLDAKEIVKTNNSISMPYIVYQFLLMIGTILGPGTIFLMMVGALTAVFEIGIWNSFLWNFIPLATFMFICLKFKQKWQLMFAFCVSAAYSLVMMAVLIGVCIQVMDDGILSPTSMFFFAVILQIIITGFLHPQEAACLWHGIIYYITIPSMYMLLVIYSLFNMNDVSWGTRENPTPAAAAKAKEPVEEKKRSRLQKLFGIGGSNEEEGSLEFSVAGLFRCMLCTHKKDSTEQGHLVHIAVQLSELNNKIRDLELKLSGNITVMQDDDDNDSPKTSDASPTVDMGMMEEEPEKSVNLLPDWIFDPDIRNGDTKTLPAAEEQFWKDLIEKYLKPLDLSDAEKNDIKVMLSGLRDMCVFAFLMFNALFVLIVFLFQLHKEYLHIEWPFNPTDEIHYDENSFEITITREHLQLEPIGLLFVGFFGIILVIQFLAMLVHRFATISQILASTPLDWYCGKKAKEMSAEADLRGAAIDIARRLQRPKAQWDEEDLDDSQINIARRRDTIHKILYQHANKQDWSNLETNFKRRYLTEKDLDLGRYTIKRKATQTLLETRRNTLIDRRKSVKDLRLHRKSVLQQGGVLPSTSSAPSNLAYARSSIQQYQPALPSSNAYSNNAFEIEDDMEMTALPQGPRKSIITSKSNIMQPRKSVNQPRQSQYLRVGFKSDEI